MAAIYRLFLLTLKVRLKIRNQARPKFYFLITSLEGDYPLKLETLPLIRFGAGPAEVTYSSVSCLFFLVLVFPLTLPVALQWWRSQPRFSFYFFPSHAF